MSAAVAIPDPPLFDETRLAIAGFLSRYSGPTRTAYASDLRQYSSWCAAKGLDVFAVRGVIFAVVDGLLAHSPASSSVVARSSARSRPPSDSTAWAAKATGGIPR